MNSAPQGGEKDKGRPSLDKIAELSDRLNVGVDYLITGNGAAARKIKTKPVESPFRRKTITWKALQKLIAAGMLDEMLHKSGYRKIKDQ